MAGHTDRPSLALEHNGFLHGSKPSLLILNQPILDLDLLQRLWKNSTFKICADGGANRLHDLFLTELEGFQDDYVSFPYLWQLQDNLPSIRDFYEQKGVIVTLDPDQYSTDFAKALKIIRQYSREHFAAENGQGQQQQQQQPARYTVNILGSISGRLDQGLGLLHEMLREQVADPQLDLVLFSERSISFILPPGRSRVALDVAAGIITANVGIVPIYGPATISTAGLEWDVEDWRTEMGGNVSTSNHVVREMVEVETDVRVLFTIERAKKLPPWPSNKT
ncbi:MAG: hypothetical protein Q9165_004551 [Trypethelium subeluteriae]